jgi:heme oxygenase
VPERYLPLVVLEHLETTYPKGKLIRILTWIAEHPEGGTVRNDLADLGLRATAGDEEQIRVPASIYAVKFVARLTGRSAG